MLLTQPKCPLITLLIFHGACQSGLGMLRFFSFLSVMAVLVSVAFLATPDFWPGRRFVDDKAEPEGESLTIIIAPVLFVAAWDFVFLEAASRAVWRVCWTADEAASSASSSVEVTTG